MFGIKPVRGLSTLELIIALLMLALIIQIGFSAYQNYRMRMKASEAVIHVNDILDGEQLYYARTGQFTYAGPTNFPPPRGIKLEANFSLDPHWKLLNFMPTEPLYYGYQAILISNEQVDCMAMGDLNANGMTSLFRRSLFKASPGLRASRLFIFDELE